jgi:hypothetical protein
MVFGILSGAVTLIAYLFPDSDSLLETLGELLPDIGGSLAGLADAVVQFAESWPLGPWLSALVAFLVIAILRFLAEYAFDLFTVEVTFSGVFAQALVFLPLALLWIWIFSGVVTALGLVAFVAGYFLSIIISIFVASLFG